MRVELLVLVVVVVVLVLLRVLLVLSVEMKMVVSGGKQLIDDVVHDWLGGQARLQHKLVLDWTR